MKSGITKTKYDVIIVGTGAAGLYGALQFDESINVLLISKKAITLSNSSLAQGGVASVLDKSNDNYNLHIADTLIAGKYKNNLSSVELLVSEGPKDVLAIKDLGVDFDTDKDGNLQMTLEAGHSRHRIVHHKDSTGKEIVDTLLKNVLTHKNIDIIDNTLVFSIIKAHKGFNIGVIKDDIITEIATKYCILCTGGIGRVYKYTTNSAIATGDGITLAYELGAKIKYLSRVQFHPTAFAAEKDRERFLISEAVRGEGAVLLNCNGKRFAFDYDSRGELAPRDVVSEAIMKEAKKTKSENFYLDITHKDPEFVKNRFPMIYANCLEEGIDITKDKIPIFPCQHYLMGGIDVNLQARTTIDRLYAAGECSHTGVHGANRLASNSLLEALVFSRKAAEDIKSRIKIDDNADFEKDLIAVPPNNGNPLPHGLRTEIRNIIQSTYFVFIHKDKISKGLKRAAEILNLLKTGNYKITTDFIEAKSLATVAVIILTELKEEYKV